MLKHLIFFVLERHVDVYAMSTCQCQCLCNLCNVNLNFEFWRMLFWWFPDNVVCWETPETRPALVGNLIVFQDKGCSLVSLLSIQEIDNILVEPGDSKP